MTAMAYVWLAAAVVFGIVEGVTYNLVSVWFAGGAVAAFFTALLGGGNEDFELFAHRLLANVIGQSYRAKGSVDAFFIRACCFRGDDAFDVLHEKNFLPFEKLVCHGF